MKLKWMDISCAPRDGTTVMLFAAGRVTVGAYLAPPACYPGHPWLAWNADVLSAGGFTDDERGPSHWAPLPKQPNAEVTGLPGKGN